MKRTVQNYKFFKAVCTVKSQIHSDENVRKSKISQR